MPYNKLLIPETWERHWTAYPEGFTILEALMDWVSKVNHMTDDLNDWEEYLDDFKENIDQRLAPFVDEVLYKMSEDGTLDKIINQNIFKDLNDSILQYGYNVKMLGAKGDKATDDTDSIQLALNMAKAKGGGKVFVPEGTYRVTKSLTIWGNTELNLTAKTKLHRDHNSYFILNAERNSNPPKYDGEGNIKIEGGIWDANGKEYPNATAFAIGHATNFTMRDLTLLDVGGGSHGIEFNACRLALVENCQFLGNYLTKDTQKPEAIQLDISKRRESFPAFGAYDNTPCKEITVRGCYFGNSDTPGSTPWVRAIGSHGSTIGVWHEDIIIDGNTFEKMTERTIRCYSYRKTKIVNNIFKNCQYGVLLRSPDLNGRESDRWDKDGVVQDKSQKSIDFVIDGNSFWGTGGTVISIAGQNKSGNIENIAITNNVFRGNKGNCIYGTTSNMLNINNNSFFGNSSTNIHLTACISVAIASNTFRNVYGTAITMKDRTFAVSVTGNTIEDCEGSGIYILSSVIDCTIANNVIKQVGTKLEDSYNIKVTSECLRYIITGNVCEQNKIGGEDNFSCYVTSTNNEGINTGNIYKNGFHDTVSKTDGGNL